MSRRHNSVVMARGKEVVGAGWRGTKGENGDICNNVNDKNKVKTEMKGINHCQKRMFCSISYFNQEGGLEWIMQVGQVQQISKLFEGYLKVPFIFSDFCKCFLLVFKMLKGYKTFIHFCEICWPETIFIADFLLVKKLKMR